MQSAYRIALAESVHLPQIEAIEVAAGDLFPETELPDALRATFTPRAELAKAQAAGRLWVAVERSGQPVGFAYVRLVEGEPHLQEMDVHPGHGRRGIGTRLLRQVSEWARAGGFRRVTLTSFRFVPWNRPFYERMGFRCLEPEELTPALAQILRDEADEGFDPSRRVAMRLDLSGRPGTPAVRERRRPT